MWAKQLKDRKTRFYYNKNEFKNLPLSFLLSNPSLDSVYRFALSKKFSLAKKKNFRTQIKNRCVISLRSRSTLRNFRLSRIVFRSFASSGLLLGIKKSSW